MVHPNSWHQVFRYRSPLFLLKWGSSPTPLFNSGSSHFDPHIMPFLLDMFSWFGFANSYSKVFC